jgi:glucans biosynthesis protein C
MAIPVTQDRLHYMDHLRALAMVAGVLFHAALAYSPLMQRVFPTTSTHTLC